jgi:hypothetical protein
VLQETILDVTTIVIAANWMVNVAYSFVSASLYVDEVIVCYSYSCMFTRERRLQIDINLLLHSALLNVFLIPLTKILCLHFVRVWGLHPPRTCSLTTDPCASLQLALKFLGLPS